MAALLKKIGKPMGVGGSGSASARIRIFTQIIALITLLCVRETLAVARTWDNGGGDNLWTTATNWNPDGTPGSGDAITFNSGSANCYFDGFNVTITSITFTSGYTGRFEWGYGQFGKGIRGQYFSDNAYTGSTYSRVDANINFPNDWGTTTPTGIGADSYRVIWHGHVLPQYSGTYTFYESTDDGGRLWVDGTLVINQFVDGTGENSGTATLTAGVLSQIKFEMYENAGGSYAELRWYHASLPKELIPQSRLFPDHNGMRMTWYQNNDLTAGGGSGVNIAPFIDYNWGGASGPDDFFTGDDFSGSFEGFVIPQYTETYTFYSAKDDGTRLWVNDVALFDNWSCCSEGSGSIDLVAGVPYYIKMEYRDVTGQADVDLAWNSTSVGGKTIVPVERLSPPYWLNVSGNVDLRSGGVINMDYGEIQMIGGSAQTLIPKSSTTLARIIQNGTGGTTITTNDLVCKYLEIRTGTLNLGTGRQVTPDYFKITGGSLAFGTSTLNLDQPTLSLAGLGSATSGSAGSKLVLAGTIAQTVSGGTLTGSDLDIDLNGTAAITISSILAVGTGVVTKGGSGTVTLSGNNTWSGGYNRSGSGITYVNHNNALGTGTATHGGTSGQFKLASGVTVTNAITMNACSPGSGNGVVEGPSTSGSSGWTGAVTINSTCSNGGHFAGGNATGYLTLSGGITSPSIAPIMRNDNIILSGGGNYVDLAIAGGTTYLGATNGIPTSSEVTLGNSGTATLDLNGYSQTVIEISKSTNAGIITNSSGTLSTLTLNFTQADDGTGVTLTGNLNFTKTGSGAFDLTGASTYTGTTTVSAGTLVIAAAGSIIGTDSFILHSGGNATVDGTLTLASSATGVFGIGYGVASGTSTFTMNTGSAVNIGTGGGRTFVGGGPSGGPYGTGVLTIAGGTLTVAAAGAFPNDKVFVAGYGGTGTINLNGGTLISSRQITEGTGTTSFYFNGGTFRAGISGWWFPGFDTFQVRNGGAIFDPNGLDVGIDDDLIHSTQGGDNATDGGVTVTGSSGRLFLNKTANAWTGPTTVGTGVTLLLDAAGVIPDASPVTVTGTLDLDGHSETIGSLAGAGVVDNLTGAGTYTLTTGGNDGGTTFSGIIRNTSGSVAVVKEGSGVWIVSGNNTYTGGTTINEWDMRCDHNNCYGTGTVTVNPGGLAQIWSPSGLTIPNNWVLNGSSGNSSYPTLTHDGGGGDVTLNGNISVTAASEIGMGGTTSNDLIINGVISGSGNLSIDEANGGSNNTLILNGANTFTGTLSVTTGTVRLGAAGVIPDACAVTLSGGTIDMYSRSETIGSLAGSGTVTNTSGAGTYTLTAGGNNTSTTTTTVIQNPSGTVAVTKAGTGTWTISGNSTYTGATTVSAGVLKLGHATAAMGTSAGGCVVSNGAALDLNGQTYSTAEACTITGTGVSSGGAIMNSSSTASSFAGLLTLGGAASIIAGTGNITIGNVGTITGATYNLTLGGAANGTLTSILGTTSGKLLKQDAGTWTLSGTNTYTGSSEISGGTLSTSAAANLGAPSGVTFLLFTGHGTLAVTGTYSTTKELEADGASRSITVDVAPGITFTNTGALRAHHGTLPPVYKTNTGTWVQGGDGGYVDGDIFLNAGTLEFRQASGWGDGGGDEVRVAAGTTLRLAGDAGVSFVSSVTFDGAATLDINRLTGGAGVTQSVNNLVTSGAYTLSFTTGGNVTSGTSNFQVRGTTTLGGHTVLDVAGASPEGRVTLTGNVSGATYNLTAQGTGNTVISGIIGTTSGSVTKTGAGALTLSANNTFTGGVNLTTGTLNINAASALGSGSGTFTIANGTTINNTTGGAITLSVNNPMTWNGDFTFTGTQQLNLGSGAVAMGASTRTVTVSASTLTVGGVISGTNGLTKAGAGTLALGSGSGAAWTGTTTVNAGTLQLGNPGSDNYQSAAWVVNTGGTLLSTTANVIVNTAVMTINTGGTWNLNSLGDAVGYLAGGGSITLGSAGLWLDLPATGSGSNFSGVISGTGSIDLRGAQSNGTQVFSGLNTYTGTTTVRNGTLSINTIQSVSGGSSALGAPTSAANGTLAIGSTTTTGTLIYTGTAFTTDRVIDLAGTTGGATITQSGTGLLKFTSAVTATGVGAKALTLNGSTAGTGEISGIIPNGSGTTSVTKGGSGTWTLSGANTFTGGSTHSGGTLRLTHASALGSGTCNFNNATLEVLHNGSGNNGTISMTNGFSSVSGSTQNIYVANNGSNTGNTVEFTGTVTGNATWNVTGANGYKLSIPTTSLNGGAGTTTMNATTADMILGSVASNGNGAHTLALDGSSTGSAITGIISEPLMTLALTKAGAGTWTLSGANTYTANTTVSAGTLALTHTSALGTGSGSINGGTLSVLHNGSGNGGTITFANDLLINSGFTGTLNLANNGSNTGNTVAFGTVTLGATTTLNVTGANAYLGQFASIYMAGAGAGTSIVNPTTTSLTVGSMSSGGGAGHTVQLDGTATGNSITGVMANGSTTLTVTKASAGTWILGGANTYTGTTTINGGKVILTGSLHAGSAVTVASGGTLAGTGTVSGTLAVSAGGILEPGNASEATLSTGAQTLAGTSVLTYTLSPRGSDKLAVTGNFTLDGTINVAAGTAFTYGAYTIATYTGTLTNNTLNVGTMPAGYYGSVTAGGGVVTLNILDFTGWSYVTTLNFNTTSTGANVSGNVTNFPMLVRLDSNNFIFDQATSNGRDIRFADPDGSPLVYEIERWDVAARKAEIWVLVPQVDGNSDRDFINFYWGNSSATAMSSPGGVFGATNSFKGVWHLSENGNTTGGGYADATGAYALTGAGAISASSDVEGLVGLGSAFNGSSDRIEADQQVVSAYPFTLSSWEKTVGTNGWNSMLWVGDKDASNVYHNINLSTQARVRSRSAAADVTADGTAELNDGTWHHVVGVFTSATDRKVYVDGALAGSNTGNVPFDAAIDRVSIGRTGRSAPTDYFLGTLDQAEISNAARSADWIKLAYESQRKNQATVLFPNTALSTWGFNSKIYVNTSATGANTATDVSSFPMLVRLTSANFNFSQARSDGADLRFADSTGMLLPYELSRFDAANKAAEAWVLLPTVKANNNSQWFRMYWGKAAATTLSSSNSVFQPANGIIGEYHLEEASGTILDGTGYANHMSFNGHVPNPQSAVIGKGHLFDGNGDYLNAASATNMNLSANDRLTVSAWINRSGAAAAGAWEGFVAKHKWNGVNERSFALANHTASGLSFILSTDGTSGGETNLYSYTAPVNGSWTHVAGVADGTKMRIYVNGIECANTAFSGNIYYTANAPLKIGLTDDDVGLNQQYFNGLIDEVGLANVARSADWIKLAYESQKAATTTVQVGAKPQDFAKSVRFNFNTSGVGVSGNVTNIPILVRLTSTNFDFASTTATGTDIRFVDKDGSSLYHEVVEWDKGNSVGKVWVKVPQVDGNSTTDFITLYYGCATCNAAVWAVADSVWSGFNGVWHLNGNSETAANDATRYRNHAKYNAAVPVAAGITAHEAPSFDGAATTMATAADPAGGELDFGTGDFTIGCWAKTSQPATTNLWPMPIGKNSSGAPRNGYGIVFAPPGSGPGKPYFEVIRDGNFYQAYAGAAKNDGSWHHLMGKKTATQIEFFVDGVSQGTTAYTNSTSISNANAFFIGNHSDGGSGYIGYVNEVTAAPSAFSADFIKLSYQNQKEGSTLFSSTTFTATTTSFQKSKVFTLNTTASGANVPGDVYDFPLLLRITGTAGGTAITDLTQSAGQDIRFLDGDGVTWLDYQIERWSQALDSAEVWVKVPRIRGNSSSGFITMYYQQAASVTVPDGQCASCVFSAANGFAGTYHLGTDVTSATGSYNGTDNSTGDVGGIVGRGRSFNGSSQYISIARPVQDDFTIGLWINTTQTAGSSGGWMVGNGLVDAEVAGVVNDFGVSLHGVNAAMGTGNPDVTANSGQAVNGGTWQYITATRKRSTGGMVLSVNGTQKSTATGNTVSLTAPANMNIGRIQTANNYFSGNMDEIQISSVVRDSNWNLLTYQNQRRDAAPLFNSATGDFQKSKKFTFNTTRTGANVMDSVTNFPMLVRINGSVGGTPITDLVQGTGTNAPPDIRFLDGDGKTWLNYQVERWDRGASVDSAEVWVMVPQVDGNSDHDFITMYYQQASGVTVADGQCATCVFSTANGFAGVWHLNEDGNSNVGGYLDATANANHGEGVSMTNTADVGGISGNGQVLDGSADYIRVPDGTTLDPASVTYSAWVKPIASLNHSAQVLDKSGNTGLRYRVTNANKVGLLDHGGPNTILSVAPDTVALGVWNLLAVTASASGLQIFINGSLNISNSTAYGFTNSTDSLLIGKFKNSSNENMEGVMDEAIVSNVVRSPDWMKLTYENQRPTGNKFWNARTSPNNQAVLTATAGANNIALSWSGTVTDSANADSVGLWVEYSGYPDSATAAGQTSVVRLPKTDSSYNYPATYPGTYYFALAVRNTAGVWSPFTKASSDTANLSGNVNLLDTVYVDSAIGLYANTCIQARNPATPMKNIALAMACGANALDTLVIRAMPGIYTDSFLTITSKPTVITSFDQNSRAIMNGSTTQTDGFSLSATIMLTADIVMRNMDVKAAVNNYIGIYLWSSGTRSRIEGCRIFNNGNIKHKEGITWVAGNDQTTLANNLVHQPLQDGIYVAADNSFNILNNVIVGNSTSAYAGINHTFNTGWTDMTVKNNILTHWDYGIKTVAANIGTVSNNLFHQVTSGREVTGTSDANKIVKDPLFANTTVGNPHGFKLLAGSPAIDAGSTAYASGGVYVTHRIGKDYFGNSRTIGSAPDIGLYEGTGYTNAPASEFDTLITTTTSTTVTVRNAKWKLTWDQARGAGINFFSDMSDSTTNLLSASSLLFDAKVGSYQASSQTGQGPQLTLFERSRTRVTVRQSLAVSAAVNLNIFYLVYPSGHIWVTSELENLGSGAATLTSLDFTLKLGTTTSAATGSGGSKNGFGFLNTATRDALLSATQDMDQGAATAETWTSTATAGPPGTIVFATAGASNSAKWFKRVHSFLLYIGDQSLDRQKAATLNADAYAPSQVTATSGSLLMERSWQDGLAGHWTLDDGGGGKARDKAVNNQNDATITAADTVWTSGKVGGALYLNTTDVAVVIDNAAAEACLGCTYMFWIKPDFAGMGTKAWILSKDTTTSTGWWFRKVSGQNQITFNMGAASATTPTLTDAVWTHIAAVVKPNTNKQIDLYVNGLMVANSTVAATAAVNAVNLRFGENAAGGAADRFKGTLDDIRIYQNEIYNHDIQAIYNRGFSSKFGHYALRADNNNRLVAVLNSGAAATRVQPVFQVTNWYGAKTPKFVYLNGTRLRPNADFSVDSIGAGLYGGFLVMQLNKTLTGADQTLFLDDDDSTGYMGTASAMKGLSITATANDKIIIKNFADTVFGAATSGQWYTEIDLNGWTTNTVGRVVDTGFGGFNVWKAAAINPNLSITGSANLAPIDGASGRGIVQMKFDNGAVNMLGGGSGYLSPANIGYNVVDSSATRLSLTLTPMSLSATVGTATLTKRWTIYPNGRIFGSWVLSSVSANLGDPDLDIQARYNSNPAYAFGQTYADNNARGAWYGGDLDFHSIVGGVLSVKNNNGTFTGNATTRDADMTTYNGNSGGADYRRARLKMTNALYNTGIGNITTNFFVDIGRDFADSATADSLAKDVQTPALITAITGSRITNDALDFNADNFAEGDGAYTASATSGVAHFKFANSVTSFSPAFRISSWTYGTLPEVVILDNQTLTKGYHYNAHLNAGANELVIQVNKTLSPDTHVFFFSHKTGLAVTLNKFEAKDGDGVDTLQWTTESEFENLGYHVWRRVAPAAMQIDTAMAAEGEVAGAGIANALRTAARTEAAKRAAAKMAQTAADTGLDTVPSLNMTPEELRALGYERITPKLIPGAKGGSSAGTQNYTWIDRSAAIGVAYEYLLEALDFNGSKVQYGPRLARPQNPMETELGSNYPNPFNPVTTLRFSLKEKLKVSLLVYDAKGKLVRTLVRPDKPMAAGKYRLIWDAKSDGGFEAPSGQYFYRFTAGRYVKTRKMILVK